MAPRPRWLIIVERDRRDIFEDFRRRFHGWARVILDRRETSRASEPSYEGPERRRPSADRYNPFRRTAAYRLVYRGEDFELHERADPDTDEVETGSVPVFSR